MIASGIDVVYHSLRLGEGQTTCFRPEERKATLAAVRDSDLKLAHLVEPVGPEHTDDEIADVLMAALSNGAALSGAMARINVKGTPFESHAPCPDCGDHPYLRRCERTGHLCSPPPQGGA